MTAVNVTVVRDTKWLTLEVCREFQRGTCSRADADCKFAHPSTVCHVENGRVVACFDSLKVSLISMWIIINLNMSISVFFLNDYFEIDKVNNSMIAVSFVCFLRQGIDFVFVELNQTKVHPIKVKLQTCHTSLCTL